MRPPMAQPMQQPHAADHLALSGGDPTKLAGRAKACKWSAATARTCRFCSRHCARASPDGPSARPGCAAKALDALAADLRAARFGVAVWSAAELDTLTIEMLCGLVADLNADDPLSAVSRLAAARQCARRAAGLRLDDRLSHAHGFGRGFPEHDPWRFDAARLVESGEADCALWISAYRAAAPAWTRPVPMIALTGAGREISADAARSHRCRPARPRSRRGRASRGNRDARAGGRRRTRASAVSVADALAADRRGAAVRGAWPC